MNHKNITQGDLPSSISNGVKSITRLASVLAVSAMLVAPSLASAVTSTYVDTNGNFNVTSAGPNGFFSFGNVGGGMGPFVCGANNICQVASNIIYIINAVLVPLIFAIAFIVFLYGIVLKYIFSAGDAEKVKEGHKLILWGLIAFVVMISLWGLVNVIANTFGLYGVSAPPTPRSY